MPRFAGVPIEQEERKPRFAGVPVEQPTPTPAFEDASLFMPGAAPAAPAAEPNWWDGILGGLDYAGDTTRIMSEGAREGVANVAGLPIDILNASPMLANLLPGIDGVGPVSDNPVGGSESIRELLSGFGLAPDAPEPQDAFQTIAGRTAEEIGAMAVPVAGLFGAAASKTLPAVRKAGGMTRHLLEPAMVAPRQFLAKETGLAAAAGAGAGVANTLVDRETGTGQIADLIGALGGATLGSAGTAIVGRLGDLFAALSGNPNFASRVTREKTADTLIQNSDVVGSQVDPARPYEPVDTTEIVDLLQRPAQAETSIPGFQASTADRAGDFGLGLLEDARSRGGPQAGRFRERQEANTKAVDDTLNTVAPTEEPGAFLDALGQRRDAELSRADQDVQDALGLVDQSLAPLTVPPGSTRTSRGNVVRNELLDSRETKRAATRELYEASDTSGNMVDPAELRETLDTAMARMTQTELTHIPEATVNRVRALGVAEDGATPAPIDMREASTLLTEVKELKRAAVNDGKRNANRVLGDLEDALEDFVTANVTPEQRVALDKARASRFDEAERFGRKGDPVADALEIHPGGQPKMRDERVAGSFVTPDRHLGRLFAEADTPATRSAIREEMLDRLDNSSPESITQFSNTYAQQIDRFPGLRDELAGAAGARAGEGVARTQQKEIQRLLGTPDGKVPGRSAVAKYLNNGEQAEKAMQNVLSSKSPAASIEDLLTFVRDDPQAVEGARKAFWQVMEKRGRSKNAAFETKDGIEPWMPKKWRTFLEEPNVAKVMDRLYQDNPEHLSKIREIAEALRGVNTGSKAGAAVNPSGSAQTLRGSPVTVAEAQAKIVDVQRGRLNPLYAVTYLAGKLADRVVSRQAEQAYQKLLDEALLNPQVAADLMRQNNPANRAALKRNLSLYLGNEASHLVELIDGDEGENDVKKQTLNITVGSGKQQEAE